ncbi:MAG: TetR/AcrR family transcriptional regulator [Cyanobacteria bacterium J06656_5]
MARGANKAQILEAGLSLFYSKGYNATGIQDIANAAEVPKGSFYNYFKSKEDFAAEVINHYTRQTIQFLEERLKKGKRNHLARMKLVLEYWAENMFSEYKGLGCLVGNLTQEMGNQSDKIKQAAKEGFSHLESCFIVCLQAAQESGEIGPDNDVKKLGTFVYNGWQGALVRSKSEGNSKQLIAYVEYTFDVVFPCILTQENNA